MLPPYLEVNVEMASSRLGRIVTVEERLGVERTLVVTRQLANSNRAQSVIPAMKTAVLAAVSLLRMGLSAAPVLEHVIFRRHVAVPVLCAQRILPLQMVSTPFLSHLHF